MASATEDTYGLSTEYITYTREQKLGLCPLPLHPSPPPQPPLLLPYQPTAVSWKANDMANDRLAARQISFSSLSSDMTSSSSCPQTWESSSPLSLPDSYSSNERPSRKRFHSSLLNDNASSDDMQGLQPKKIHKSADELYADLTASKFSQSDRFDISTVVEFAAADAPCVNPALLSTLAPAPQPEIKPATSQLHDQVADLAFYDAKEPMLSNHGEMSLCASPQYWPSIYGGYGPQFSPADPSEKPCGGQFPYWLHALALDTALMVMVRRALEMDKGVVLEVPGTASDEEAWVDRDVEEEDKENRKAGED